MEMPILHIYVTNIPSECMASQASCEDRYVGSDASFLKKEALVGVTRRRDQCLLPQNLITTSLSRPLLHNTFNHLQRSELFHKSSWTGP